MAASPESTKPLSSSSPRTSTEVKPLVGAELEAYKKRQYDFSDPARFGRGAWLTFLNAALEADDVKEELLFVCRIIRRFCRYCKCGDCHGHCTNYLSQRPPEQAATSSRELFNYIVAFMSAVNVRTGRPPYDAEILYGLFTDQKLAVCTAGCGAPSVGEHSASEGDALAGKTSASEWLRQVQERVPGLVHVEPYPAVRPVRRSNRYLQ